MAEIHAKPRVLILQVVTTHYHTDDAIENMTDTIQLVETYGAQVVKKEIQHRVKPDPATYIGKGKVEWLKQAIKDYQVDVVIFNDIVKAGQLFRVEKELWEVNHLIQVWDRVGLILNIFDQHASTNESKLQIELARIEYDRPRIYGLGVDRLSRQGGGVGTRGAGETNIEQERRNMKAARQKVLKQLEKAQQQRHQMIKHRTTQGLGPVALVGYTSAGKTTLFNKLTGKEKETNAGLFTTLDTVVGKMKSDKLDKPVVISDTIGFIQNLPPKLVKSFQSTLLESIEAELLLHVVDASDPRVLEKIEVVRHILEELNVTIPTIIVLNKVDQIGDYTEQSVRNVFSDREVILVSAKTCFGITRLKDIICTSLDPSIND